MGGGGEPSDRVIDFLFVLPVYTYRGTSWRKAGEPRREPRTGLGAERCSELQFLVCKGNPGMDLLKQMLKLSSPPLVISVLARQKTKKAECLQR